MRTLLACSLRVGIGALVAVAVFLGPATVASAEIITDRGADRAGDRRNRARGLAGDRGRRHDGWPATIIKCKKVHGWHGLKHPLFGYFYWRYILTIRWCWHARGLADRQDEPTPGRPRTGATSNAASSSRGGTSSATRRSSIDGGVNRGQYRVRSQGKFQQCFQFCFNTKTPWVRLTGYPGRRWGFAHGN